jgi:hypothetical protein
MAPVIKHSRITVQLRLIPILLLCLSGLFTHVSAQADEPAVIIEWPNEGETLYAGPDSLLHKIPIRGRVVANGYPISDLEIELEVISEGKTDGRMVGTLSEDGAFEFFVTVNPHGPTQQFEIAFTECGYECHSSGFLDLPPGEINLVVRVSAPNGGKVEAHRRILVDISGEAIVPVQLTVIDDLGQNIAGISVSASTRVYLWRARFFSGTSDENGMALVTVEALKQAPTEYVFEVDRQIIDGILYEGSVTQTVILSPGAESAPMVMIPVTSRRGTITGDLLADNRDQFTGLPIWAIRPHNGESYLTTIDDDGTFTFESIPLDQYVVTLDKDALLSDGFVSDRQYLDLLANPDVETVIPIIEDGARVIDGVVTSDDGAILPFAWISVEDEDLYSSVFPSNGRYAFSLRPSDSTTVVAHAPGFYGKSQQIDLSSDPETKIDFVLTRQDETEVLRWGNGEVFIPVESDIKREHFALTLRKGWIWGNIEGEPLHIRVAGKELILSEASFSIEYLPGRRAWLYVYEGSAQVNSIGGADIAVVESEQMINLLNDGALLAVSMDPIVIEALREDGNPPIPITWEPSLGSRLQDFLTRAGIGTVQLVTFVTYFLVSLGVLLIPFLAVYLWWKRRS